MTTEQIDKVMKFVENGGLVKISSPYLDSFATINENSDDELTIRSQVLCEQRLVDVAFSRLTFYREEVL